MLFPNTYLNPIHPMTEDVNYFRLDDGRVWSVNEAKFVESVPEGMNYGTCPDKQGKFTVEGLLDMLRWNKYPLGEFATDEDLAKEAREKRDSLLSETDHYALIDSPLPQEKKQAILEYRQLLRDIPQQPGFPRQITWPEKPVI